MRVASASDHCGAPTNPELGTRWAAANGGTELIRARKFCPECKLTFEGWWFVRDLKKAPMTKRGGKTFIIATCGECIDIWEQRRARMARKSEIEKLKDVIAELPNGRKKNRLLARLERLQAQVV